MTDRPFPKTIYAYLDEDDGEYFLLEEELSDCLGVGDAKIVGVYNLGELLRVKKKIETVTEVIPTFDLPLDK